MSKTFHDKHSSLQMDIIQSIEPIKKRPDQPDFINMTSVNGQEVAFLGDSNIEKEYEQFLYKFIRIDRMVIPAFARMVNIDSLEDQLLDARSTSAIDTSIRDFFYEGKLESTVTLNVCGMLQDSYHPNMNIHPCENNVD